MSSGKGDKHDWWLRQWDKFDHEGRNADANTLPRLKDDFTKLPEKEHHAGALMWLSGVKSEPSLAGITHLENATTFAHAITSADPEKCLKALLHHHEQHGGGLRWGVLRDR